MNTHYWLGIDIGSTTVKTALVNPETKAILHRTYVRHGAKQRETTRSIIKQLSQEFPVANITPILCGSGARSLAEELKIPYIQEVVANSLAVREFHPESRVAIELGGQDAKIIFFRTDESTGELMASDMRMNGICAGGTGAFLDEVATLLKVPVEQLDSLAAKGTRVYDVSGRCGVFAKTDIQPLLNQGVPKEDLALSCFHAVAKQTIGGLAQGLTISPPVIFEGGPLAYNPTLIRVYTERLGIQKHQTIVPENQDVLIAHGAALGIPAMFPDAPMLPLTQLAAHPAFTHPAPVEEQAPVRPYFENQEEQEQFQERHALPALPSLKKFAGQALQGYLGIDAGSTTSKFVLLHEDGTPVHTFYAKNEGEPLEVMKEGLLALKRQCDELNIELTILGAGSTGYGENLFAQAFGCDHHTVETIAHARAALEHDPKATFILDIGGQDMKAIFLDKGVITGITLNEACSAGCGSFLENFASTLNIGVEEIAPLAFSSPAPSVLGSRCTVFMNSSVISEQKNGKTPADIMAGLCNSVIENVFTKVIRLSNLKNLGENIIVQGGTFRNDAVLRAIELFAQKEVRRAPYPGEMGAIGIALLTREKMQESGRTSQFPSWEELKNLTYTQESGLVCQFCSNHCNRTIVRFSNGGQFITGNRCERGEILSDAPKANVKEQLIAIRDRQKATPNLMDVKRQLLFADYSPTQLSPSKALRIGIPRALEFWHSYPFWNALYTSLGFEVVLSDESDMDMFHSGISSIPSDTVCFPAKLTHGHLKNLVEKNVDRIFMPMISRMVSENSKAKSEHVCAVVKGYPLVLEISDNPEENHNIPLDKPVFHWTCEKAKRDSISSFLASTFGISKSLAKQAIQEGDKAQNAFTHALEEAGTQLLDSLKDNEFAVVIAGRPYHADELINHDIPAHFNRLGVPVLPLEALPSLHEANLNPVRAELTVNFHVRMFSGAKRVAEHPKLEYLQIVSFGCGHDAVITDEVTRLLSEGAGKSPLVLKLDESDVSGPLGIRIRSFVETVQRRRSEEEAPKPKELPAPYTLQFTKKHREKIMLVPNVSWAFGQIASAALGNQGYRVEALPMANRHAVAQGKRFVHNDMCYPAQITVGELIAALDQGLYHPDDVTYIMSKPKCDCRLAHYTMMARSALDDAGYSQVAIASLDPDDKNLSPGFTKNPLFDIHMVWGLLMSDQLEALRRKIRPYELSPGQTNRWFEDAILSICENLAQGVKPAFNAYKEALERLNAIPYDRSVLKPKVFVIGEFLLNFHPTSNNDIEDYLEANGMEVLMPALFNNIHREFHLEMDLKREYHVRIPAAKDLINRISDKIIRSVHAKCQKEAATHPLFEPAVPLREIAQRASHIVDKTFTSGEGWQIAGEILHLADHNVDSFVILQPFGCLPNHIIARGVIKKLKEEKPGIQILPLDFDPDTSQANIENRLQMLIINAKQKHIAQQSA